MGCVLPSECGAARVCGTGELGAVDSVDGFGVEAAG